MPELPDLENFSRNLHKNFAGKKLVKLKLSKAARLNVSAVVLKKKLVSQKLIKVYREGKELRFVFSNKAIMGIHLMLRGRFYQFSGENIPKHSLAEFFFQGGQNFALTDFQRNARITIDPPETSVPDALSKVVNERFWKEQLLSKAAIKNLLLDQHIVRGIGNAYADEILWKAGISPFSIANKIPSAKIKKLSAAVKTVLNRAIKEIKKTDPDIIGGEIRSFLQIHNSSKKKDPSGNTILQKSVGGRKTYYTDEQQLFR